MVLNSRDDAVRLDVERRGIVVDRQQHGFRRIVGRCRVAVGELHAGQPGRRAPEAGREGRVGEEREPFVPVESRHHDVQLGAVRDGGRRRPVGGILHGIGARVGPEVFAQGVEFVDRRQVPPFGADALHRLAGFVGGLGLVPGQARGGSPRVVAADLLHIERVVAVTVAHGDLGLVGQRFPIGVGRGAEVFGHDGHQRSVVEDELAGPVGLVVTGIGEALDERDGAEMTPDAADLAVAGLLDAPEEALVAREVGPYLAQHVERLGIGQHERVLGPHVEGDGVLEVHVHVERDPVRGAGSCFPGEDLFVVGFEEVNFQRRAFGGRDGARPGRVDIIDLLFAGGHRQGERRGERNAVCCKLFHVCSDCGLVAGVLVVADQRVGIQLFERNGPQIVAVLVEGAFVDDHFDVLPVGRRFAAHGVVLEFRDVESVGVGHHLFGDLPAADVVPALSFVEELHAAFVADQRPHSLPREVGQRLRERDHADTPTQRVDQLVYARRAVEFVFGLGPRQQHFAVAHQDLVAAVVVEIQQRFVGTLLGGKSGLVIPVGGLPVGLVTGGSVAAVLVAGAEDGEFQPRVAVVERMLLVVGRVGRDRGSVVGFERLDGQSVGREEAVDHFEGRVEREPVVPQLGHVARLEILGVVDLEDHLLVCRVVDTLVEEQLAEVAVEVISQCLDGLGTFDDRCVVVFVLGDLEFEHLRRTLTGHLATEDVVEVGDGVLHILLDEGQHLVEIFAGSVLLRGVFVDERHAAVEAYQIEIEPGAEEPGFGQDLLAVRLADARRQGHRTDQRVGPGDGLPVLGPFEFGPPAGSGLRTLCEFGAELPGVVVVGVVAHVFVGVGRDVGRGFVIEAVVNAGEHALGLFDAFEESVGRGLVPREPCRDTRCNRPLHRAAVPGRVS